MFMKKWLLSASVFLCAFSASAFDYPFPGNNEENFLPVFEKIRDGRCCGMEEVLAELEKKEGVSGNLYQGLCYFESDMDLQGFYTVKTMVENEEFDEAAYLVDFAEKKKGASVNVYKYRGLALYGKGDLAGAESNALKVQSMGVKDPEITYLLTDIHLNRGNLEIAETTLETVPFRDERYYYRKGQIELQKGKLQSAMKNLREVKSAEYEDEAKKSSKLVGNICEAQGRTSCAVKPAEDIENDDEESVKADSADKKLFGAIIAIGEQYDTNVTSIDENKADSFSEKKSLRTYILADLKLNFYDTVYDKIEIGLQNYKSWNHSVPEYNAQIHKLYAGFTKRYDSIELVFPRLSYEFTMMDDRKYSDAFAIEVEGSYITDSWRVYVPLSATFKDYRKNKVKDYNLDGERYKGGLGVQKAIGSNYLLDVKTAFGAENTDGKFSRTGTSELAANLSARISEKTTALAGYSLTYYDYSHGGRNDTYHNLRAVALYKFMDRHFINAGYSFSKNDSNRSSESYKKHVFDIGLSYLY